MAWHAHLIEHQTDIAEIIRVQILFGTGSERPNTRKGHLKKAHVKTVPERPTLGYHKGLQCIYVLSFQKLRKEHKCIGMYRNFHMELIEMGCMT